MARTNYTVMDLGRMATALGCRLRIEIYPKELDVIASRRGIQTSGTFPALNEPKRKPKSKGKGR